MNIRDIRTRGLSSNADLHEGPPGFRKHVISRRQFAHTAAGAAAVGAALGSAWWRPVPAWADGSVAPKPIPGGTPALGGAFHVFGPTPDGSFDPIDAEPSTITDFNGFVGLAYISGTVKKTNRATGEVRILPFVNSDMRFMKGVFRGTDGRIHQGAFALVWVDVYAPGPGAQIHDLNPSAFPPIHLFWTIEIPADGVQVNPGKGAASMKADDVPIIDYGDIVNALFGGGPAPTPGSVSFKVVWSGVNDRVNIRNDDPVFGGFAGTFVRNSAQMEWTATVGDITFVSAPLATSSSSFAELGQERNGSFFP